MGKLSNSTCAMPLGRLNVLSDDPFLHFQLKYAPLKDKAMMTPETQKQLKITDVSAKKLDKLNLHTAWDCFASAAAL